MDRDPSEDEPRHRPESLSQTETLATVGSILSSVAHELNNLLVVVKGQAYLIDHALTGTAHARRAQKISQAAERCERLVRSVLGLAYRRAPEPQWVQLNSVVLEALDLLAYQLRVDNVRVVSELTENLPALWADPRHLHQLVIYLLTNGCDAMRNVSPRQLTLRTWPAPDRVCLEVGDSGPGVPPDLQARSPRSSDTTKGDGPATALTLCTALVEAHRGTLSLVGVPGQGCVFRIELPVTSPESAGGSGEPRTRAQV